MSAETTAILVAAITSASSLFVAMVNHGRLARLHVDINSRLDAALAAQRELGRAEGRAEQPGPRS